VHVHEHARQLIATLAPRASCLKIMNKKLPGSAVGRNIRSGSPERLLDMPVAGRNVLLPAVGCRWQMRGPLASALMGSARASARAISTHVEPEDRMADIVDLIKSQHRQMDDLLQQAQGEDSDTVVLLSQVALMLVPHSQAEESFVYPAIRDLRPSELEEVEDGAAEHHHVEQLLHELLSSEPGAPGFDGKLEAMIAELRHHVKEEEEELLPVLSDSADDDQRNAMAERFAQETGNYDDSHAQQSRARTLAEGFDADPATAATVPSMSRQELYQKAKEHGIKGRSKMSKSELAQALE
jgi:hemerythrin superfamily protein